MNVNRTLKLGRNKPLIVKYLEGKATGQALAEAFGVHRNNAPTIINTIVRHLVQTGKLNARELINKY